MKQRIKQYDRLSLQELSEKLNLNYYDIITDMSHVAMQKLEELKAKDIHQCTSQYTELCSKALEHIARYLHHRKQELLPYLNELHDKDITGHNCSACTGGCDIRHHAYLAELQQSHKDVCQLLYQLQTAALPLYSELPPPGIYRSLRDEMLLIDTIMKELFHMEEANLIPKMLQSQKKINAGSR
jgi:hypothetical protein